MPRAPDDRELRPTRAASSTARRTRRWLDAAFLVACVAVSSAVSIALGQDANWDLQNYHFYGPWALLEGRAFGCDIAAAQLQTYLNPLLDLPFYAMVAADWDPRADLCRARVAGRHQRVAARQARLGAVRRHRYAVAAGGGGRVARDRTHRGDGGGHARHDDERLARDGAHARRPVADRARDRVRSRRGGCLFARSSRRAR